MSRAALSRATVAMIGVFAVVLLVAAAKTLAPSERTKADAPSVEVPNIPVPGFAYVANPRPLVATLSELLLVRLPNGKLVAWEVPTTRGRHTLPDFHWWKPEYLCKSFQPDFASGEVGCTDPDAPEWLRKTARWSLNGRSLTAGFDDLVAVEGYEHLGHFVLAPQ
jgi:hypothetical protein